MVSSRRVQISWKEVRKMNPREEALFKIAHQTIEEIDRLIATLQRLKFEFLLRLGYVNHDATIEQELTDTEGG